MATIHEWATYSKVHDETPKKKRKEAIPIFMPILVTCPLLTVHRTFNLAPCHGYVPRNILPHYPSHP